MVSIQSVITHGIVGRLSFVDSPPQPPQCLRLGWLWYFQANLYIQEQAVDCEATDTLGLKTLKCALTYLVFNGYIT